ncbi:nucleic acid-binding, OB-fold protein [Tanacetum coccineum]
MDIPAISCPSCNANVESANHVFFECDIATDMWKLVFRWCDIPLFQASSWDSFNDWIISWHASKEKKHRFYVITTSVLWWLWRYRNSVTFSSQPLRKSDLFDNVRFSSFSWLHNRDHMKLSWNDWLMWNDDCMFKFCSGLLHISNITRGEIVSVSDVLALDEKVKVLVVKSMFPDKISLSTAELESEPGLFLSNKEKVFSEAAELAKKYKQKLPAVSATRKLEHLSSDALPFNDEERIDLSPVKDNIKLHSTNLATTDVQYTTHQEQGDDSHR